MSVVDTGARRTQEAQYNAASSYNTLTCQVEVDGHAQAPSGTSTVSLYKPGAADDDPIVDAATATLDATTNILSYSFATTDISAYPLQEHYRAVFTFTVSSKTHKRVVLFDVVRTPIIHRCPVNPNHLRNVHAEFDRALAQHFSADTEAQANAKVARDLIMPAWNECLDEVEVQGWRPALISSPDVLFNWCRYGALVNLARFLMREPNDLRAKLFDDFVERAGAASKKVTLRYQPGDSTSTEKIRGFSQPRLLVGPDIWSHR